MQAAAEQRDQYARTIEKVHTVQDRGRMRHMKEALEESTTPRAS